MVAHVTQLASTGSHTAPELGVALVLLVVGTAAVRLGRKRRAH